ncbi:MAG TPA: glycosyltransferase family 39 protein [Elusimicrobiota bacterium]|nr:glycosyltransferase family 39 protein [Elusimicrobiota bacterium]
MVERLDSRRFDAAAFALALALRLAFLAVWLIKDLGKVYQPDLYYSLAQSWLGWTPMPAFDATHPPFYTGFIAAVLGLFRSPNPLSVLVLQCLLGAASVVLLRRIAERLTDAKTARWAALWVAADPALVFFTPQLQTETLFVAMELVFFIGLLRLLEEPLSWRLVLLGVWGGLCALCRSVFGAYPAILFLALWRTKGFTRAFALCAVLGIGWFVPNLAWTARNYRKYGGFVPMSAQMGWTLYEGFSLDREEVRRRPYEMADEAKSRGLSDPREEGRYFMAKTKAFVVAHPLAAAKIVAGKAFLYWRPFPYDPHTWWQRGALGVYYLIVFALGIAGACAAGRREAWAPVWALFVYLSLVHAVFFTSLRYRLPLEPFLCLLAAAGALKLARERRGA